MAVPDSIPATATVPLFPAVCHVSIIAEPRNDLAADVRTVLAGFNVVTPLAEGLGTPAGRHRALRVSVALASREESQALDLALRAVPGVRMIL